MLNELYRKHGRLHFSVGLDRDFESKLRNRIFTPIWKMQREELIRSVKNYHGQYSFRLGPPPFNSKIEPELTRASFSDLCALFDKYAPGKNFTLLDCEGTPIAGRIHSKS